MEQRESLESERRFQASDYNRLQQELIEVRTQRDRQISQLMRLNRFSDALLTDLEPQAVLETFAEAIVDILDVAIGAIWLECDVLPGASRFASCGMRLPVSAWETAGHGLLAMLPEGRSRKATPLTREQVGLLSGPALVDPLACRCVGRNGTCRGLLLAANCQALAGMAEPVWEESLQVLSLLAEKLAAHLDRCADRQLIDRQIALLQQSEERLSAVLKGANDGWWDLDLISGECFLSARWLEMLGEPATAHQTDGRFWRERIHPQDAQRFEWLLDQVIGRRNDILEAELRLRCRDGQYLPVLIRGTVIRRSDGTPQRFSGSMQDLSERKRYEAQVHRLAFYDSLTDLPNRRMLQQRMQEVIRLRETSGLGFSMMMLDLDHFKTLNDSHGHAAGDELLCVVAQRLQGCLRRSDMVARLGGDEFVILVSNLRGDAEACEAITLRLAQKIIDTIAEPIKLACATIHQGISLGIALPTTRLTSFEKLMQQADLALYEAKAAGRNKYRLFQEELQLRVDKRSQLEARIREGLRTDSFDPAYQLQVNNQRVPVGCEALIRWVGANGQPVYPPAEFIPVAQDSGLIHSLGDLMMRRVIADLPLWEARGLPEDFRVSINFSTPEFLRPDFVDMVVRLLEGSGVSGRRLRFEITEDSVLNDLVLAGERMNELMQYQIEFSLDDFGTGYSSFSYLRYLPVREVKIDQGFVRRFLHQPQDAAIVRAILDLGRSLDLQVVAEGVETEAQWAALRDEGCSLFQGWLFDRPCLERDRSILDRLATLQPLGG
jgi:diguanylate cyclase (GGDEF)-like protein/PAS domain S-box-containing protein